MKGDVTMPAAGRGAQGLLEVVEKVLKYSVNTWSEGFLDKLYGGTNAVRETSSFFVSRFSTGPYMLNYDRILESPG